jgi:hypothetical protein
LLKTDSEGVAFVELLEKDTFAIKDWVRIHAKIDRFGVEGFLEIAPSGQKVRLEARPCKIAPNGHRFMFECPHRGCGRFVRTLYLPHRGPDGPFAEWECRHCHRVMYPDWNREYKKRKRTHVTGLLRLRDEIDRLIGLARGEPELPNELERDL